LLRSKVAVFVDLFLMTRQIQRKAQQEQELLDQTLRANAERLRAERALRIAEQRQAAIIRSLPIILYLEAVDAAPRVPKFVSGNFAALTGFTFERVQKKPTLWHDRLHPTTAIAWRRRWRCASMHSALAIEYRWQCADGRYRHFLDQAVLVRDRRRPSGRICRHAARRYRPQGAGTQLLHARKMDAIGQLTGGIAHDFNNLLAAVIGGLGMIERRVTLDDDQRKIVSMTQRAAEQGADLVARLLAFARKQKLEPAAIPSRHWQIRSTSCCRIRWAAWWSSPGKSRRISARPGPTRPSSSSR
jgi:PAS domain-containing protein